MIRLLLMTAIVTLVVRIFLELFRKESPLEKKVNDAKAALDETRASREFLDELAEIENKKKQEEQKILKNLERM